MRKPVSSYGLYNKTPLILCSEAYRLGVEYIYCDVPKGQPQGMWIRKDLIESCSWEQFYKYWHNVNC